MKTNYTFIRYLPWSFRVNTHVRRNKEKHINTNHIFIRHLQWSFRVIRVVIKKITHKNKSHIFKALSIVIHIVIKMSLVTLQKEEKPRSMSLFAAKKHGHITASTYDKSKDFLMQNDFF